MAKKKKFGNSLTFKVLCAFVVVILLAVIYNFIVDAKTSGDTTEDEEQIQAEQVKAEKDTIDIIGDYLWPKAASRKTATETSDTEEQPTDGGSTKKTVEAKSDTKVSIPTEVRHDPIPAPVHDAVPTAVPQANTKSDVSPMIEKIETPRVEKID